MLRKDKKDSIAKVREFFSEFFEGENYTVDELVEFFHRLAHEGSKYVSHVDHVSAVTVLASAVFYDYGVVRWRRPPKCLCEELYPVIEKLMKNKGNIALHFSTKNGGVLVAGNLYYGMIGEDLVLINQNGKVTEMGIA